MSPSLYCFSGRWCPFVYYYGRMLPYVCGCHGPRWPLFMATTPAVLSLRLHLQCNLGMHYLLELTAPVFAVSGRLQSVATRRASLPCTMDVSRPRTRDTTSTFIEVCIV